jgi:DNA invertase Pin-like site-specific DNA recombinase
MGSRKLRESAMQEGYYLIYLRKSRADVEAEKRGEMETLSIHREQLTKFAKNGGYRVAETFSELVSGESIAARTEFKKVMKRIEEPGCRGVIVHAIDRLGRGDPFEYGMILSAFRFSDTLIVTPQRTYDPNDRADLQVLKLQMFVSNIEFEHIRERMRQGSVASAQRGNYIGSRAPYGYSKVWKDRRPTLEPDRTEAPVVRRIYSMAAAGVNKGSIARSLNESGIHARSGGLWTAQRIGAVLANPVHKGVIRYGLHSLKQVSRDGIEVRKKRVRNEGGYVETQGVHEPLVSIDEWEQANRRAFEGIPVKAGRSVKNPLAGLIVCGKCGRALIRQNVRNRYGSEYSRLHHVYYTECQCKSISLDYVMDKLVDALEQVSHDIEIGIVEKGSDEDEIAALDAAIEEEERRIGKLIELYEAEAITISEFVGRRTASDDRKAKMKKRREKIVSKAIDAQEVNASVHEALEALRRENVSAETKNAVLRSFIDKIEYFELDQARSDRRIRLDIHLRAF